MTNKGWACLFLFFPLMPTLVLPETRVFEDYETVTIDQSWIDQFDEIYMFSGGTITISEDLKFRRPLVIGGHNITIRGLPSNPAPAKIIFVAESGTSSKEKASSILDQSWVHISPGSSDITFKHIAFHGVLLTPYHQQIISIHQASNVTFQDINFLSVNNLQALVRSTQLSGLIHFKSIRIDRFSSLSAFYLSGFQASGYPDIYFDDIQFGNHIYCPGIPSDGCTFGASCTYNFSKHLLTLENIANFRLNNIQINGTLVSEAAFNFPIRVTDLDWMLERFARLPAKGVFHNVSYDWLSNPDGKVFHFGSLSYRNLSINFLLNNFHTNGSENTDGSRPASGSLHLQPIPRCCGTSPPEIHPTPTTLNKLLAITKLIKKTPVYPTLIPVRTPDPMAPR